MSVLIKGMDMPKNCMECPINDSCYKATVDITSDVPKNVKADWITSRANWCPMVEIPTPHGRLIDGDKAEERLFSYYSIVNRTTNKKSYRGDTLMDYEVADMIEDCVSDAPTVIESEE